MPWGGPDVTWRRLGKTSNCGLGSVTGKEAQFDLGWAGCSFDAYG